METSRASRADLIDPAQLASLGRMEIVAKWVVDGFLQGLHRSPRKGFSVEFAEFRPYQPGDDLRYIDWKIVARADKWMVKQFEEETNMRAAIVLDVSKSMDWRSARTDETDSRTLSRSWRRWHSSSSGRRMRSGSSATTTRSAA